MHAYNGRLIDSHESPQLNTKAVIDALKFVWDVARNEQVNIECDYQCQHNKFLSGQLAYIINGVWAYRDYQAALSENLVVNPIPSIDGNIIRPYFSSIVAFVPAAADSKERTQATQALMQYMQTLDFQREIWLTMSDLPAHQKVLNEIKELDNPDLLAILNALNEAVALPTSSNMLYVWEALLMGYRRYGSGALSAESAAQYMQSRAEKFIARSQSNRGE